MNKELKEELIKFKEASLRLREELEKGNYNTLDDLISNRKIAINHINELTYGAEEFGIIAKELKLTELEENLNLLMKRKRAELKGNINRLYEQKSANSSYKSKFELDSLYLNKKI